MRLKRKAWIKEQEAYLCRTPKNRSLFKLLPNGGAGKVEELSPFFPDFFPIVKMADAEGEHPFCPKARWMFAHDRWGRFMNRPYNPWFEL